MFYILHANGKVWLSDDEISWDCFGVAQVFFDKDVAKSIAERESGGEHIHHVMELHA